MDLYKDKRGFSLVELIIVMGIMAVFAGGIAGAIGYINQGKTKKAAATLNSKLTAIQQSNMTLKGATYLYLYKDGSEVYMVTSKTNYTDRDSLKTYVASNGGQTKLCSSKVDVSGSDGSSTGTLSDDNMIRISYSKGTGAYTYCDMGSDSVFYNTIKLEGTETFTVKLVKNTGKHFVE
jgi:prepilin-type N-terminal cleavage/methylation domain-containing protein